MSERDPLTELAAFVRGEAFSFNPSYLTLASNYLQDIELRLDTSTEDGAEEAQDVATAIAACEAIYTGMTTNRTATARLLPIAEWAAMVPCLEPNEEGESVCGGTCATCLARAATEGAPR